MVSQCDVRWNNGEIKSKCEDQSTDEDPLTIIPVEYLKNITFKNVYCALCNYKGPRDIKPWEIDAECDTNRFSNLSENDFSAQRVGDVIHECYMWNFLRPSSARWCYNATISSCDVDPENDTMVLLARACESYTDIVSIYKNPHCFMCHNALVNNHSVNTIFLDLISMDCPPLKNPISDLDRPLSPNRPIVSYPISILFDFSSVEGLYSKEPQFKLLPCRNDQVFDQLNKKCINLSCPLGYGLVNRTCQRHLSNSQCSLEDTTPMLIEVKCMNNVEDMSTCQPDLLLQDWVNSFINDNYNSTENLFVSRFATDIKTNNQSTICTQTMVSLGCLGIQDDDPNENLDRVLFPTNNPISALDNICGNVTFKIAIGSRNFNESCPNKTVSADNFTKLHINNTGLAFLVGETKYTMMESLYVTEYVINSSGMNSKRQTVHGCTMPSETCTFISQNMSLFEVLDNGSYIYSPLNKTLALNEYLEPGNDTMLMCSYVLQSGQSRLAFLSFTSSQSIISIFGTSLSIFALILTFITYHKFNLLRKATSGTLIMSFCATLILAQFLILFSKLAGKNSTMCLLFAVVGHYMWIAVFSHTAALAFDLHRRFGITRTFGITDEGVVVLGKFLFFAWGCPIFVVLPCLGIYLSDTNIPHFYLSYRTRTCWIGDGLANLYVFGIPVACLIFANLVLFIMVVVGLRQMKMSPVTKHKSKDSNISAELLIYFKMSTLLGFTWLFGFVAAFADVTALWYIFIILNSLQGVYIFIAFVCNKRVFKLWRESYSCLEKSSSNSSSKSRAMSSDVVIMKGSKGTMSESQSML